jgi:putative membrane protein
MIGGLDSASGKAGAQFVRWQEDEFKNRAAHRQVAISMSRPYIHRAPTRNEMRLLLNWVLSALAVWIVAHVVPDFRVRGAAAALIAALVIGFINATLGLFLKVITFPLTLITFGLFWFVVNAAMLELASAIVPGFEVHGFLAAFLGAIVLSIVNMLLRWLVSTPKERA